MASRRKIAPAVQGRPFVSLNMTLSQIWKKYEEGWRFRATRVGRPDKDGELIVPEETDERIWVGLIARNGMVMFFSQDPASRVLPKEDEQVILMEKGAPA